MITTTLVDHAVLGRVNLRCLPDGGNLETLLREQQVIGAAAWDGDESDSEKTFVGSLWFYRVPIPQLLNKHAPAWSGYGQEGPGLAAQRGALAGANISGHALGLSCFHVGRLLAGGAFGEPDPRYLGKGIGTRLLLAAIDHARRGGYRAILAGGGPDNVHSFNRWAGMMPAKVFLRNGFTAVAATPIPPAAGAGGIECPPFVYEEMNAKGLVNERIQHLMRMM
ncbi:MAG: GNAT family N-acetyltransferase [Phycisphaerae bacterium]|jgi:hypothetical protein